MKKALAVFALAAVVAFAAAPSASAARRVTNVTNFSTGTFNHIRSVTPTLSAYQSAIVKSTSNSNSYTGTNTIASTGDMDTVNITTAQANSAGTRDDLANAHDSDITVQSQDTGGDYVSAIDTTSTGKMTNNDEIAGSDALTQVVDNANNSGALSDTGANVITSGGLMTNVFILTDVANSATQDTTTFSTSIRRVSRVVVP